MSWLARLLDVIFSSRCCISFTLQSENHDVDLKQLFLNNDRLVSDQANFNLRCSSIFYLIGRLLLGRITGSTTKEVTDMILHDLKLFEILLPRYIQSQLDLIQAFGDDFVEMLSEDTMNSNNNKTTKMNDNTLIVLRRLCLKKLTYNLKFCSSLLCEVGLAIGQLPVISQTFVRVPTNFTRVNLKKVEKEHYGPHMLQYTSDLTQYSPTTLLNNINGKDKVSLGQFSYAQRLPSLAKSCNFYIADAVLHMKKFLIAPDSEIEAEASANTIVLLPSYLSQPSSIQQVLLVERNNFRLARRAKYLSSRNSGVNFVNITMDFLFDALVWLLVASDSDRGGDNKPDFKLRQDIEAMVESCVEVLAICVQQENFLKTFVESDDDNTEKFLLVQSGPEIVHEKQAKEKAREIQLGNINVTLCELLAYSHDVPQDVQKRFGKSTLPFCALNEFGVISSEEIFESFSKRMKLANGRSAASRLVLFLENC
jgi:hypothetical protein